MLADEPSSRRLEQVMAKTIFKRIIDKEIPAKLLYEDDRCLAFHDITPQAPTHVLVIPKKEITGVAAINEEDAPLVGHLLFVVRKLAEQLQLGDGYRVVINNGPAAGQTVDHLHLHLIGGRSLGWPPG
jgi:histidine triad (HIT) family protein